MPEGPEVELVRQGLLTLLQSKIHSIIVANHPHYSSQLELFEHLLSTSLVSLERRGKWLLFQFSNLFKALHHLGMSGKWRVIPLTKELQELLNPPNKVQVINFQQNHSSLQKILFEYFSINNAKPNTIKEFRRYQRFHPKPWKDTLPQSTKLLGKTFITNETPPLTLFYLLNLFFYLLVKIAFITQKAISVFHDSRTFGSFQVMKPNTRFSEHPSIKKLGAEILETPFNHSLFQSRVRKHHNIDIATLLLDQSVIAGCGNIYRAEALFLAQINPFTKVKDLQDSVLEQLGEALHFVAHRSLKHGGSSISSYQHTDGSSGSQQETFYVYNRAADPCVKCGTLIQKQKYKGRTIYWCPKCQKQ